MAEFAADFVFESISTTGTGTFSLAGSVSGLRTWVTGMGTGVVVRYVARNAAYTKWERGYGTLTDGSPATLTRTLIESSTGALIDWQTGDGIVYVHTIVSADDFAKLRARHYGATAPVAPLQAGMEWVDTSGGVTAIVEKYYDGTDWITRPWVINQTANTITLTGAVLAADPTAAMHPATKQYTDILTHVGGARLTLTTALPVTTADVTAAGTLYLTPFEHNLTKLWDGTREVLWVRNEISLALDSNSGHTGYHQSGKNFDVFEYVRSGAVVLGTGPAWTNDTTRADALGRKNGRWTNNASIVLRYGTSSGDTESVAANLANYVGTIRASANGQTEDSEAKRFVWSTYGRRPRKLKKVETTDSWNYTTATIQQANASTANQVEVVIGLSEEPVDVTLSATSTNVTSSSRWAGIGLDSTTAQAADAIGGAGSNDTGWYLQHFARYLGYPGIGWHKLTWLEASEAVGTTAWKGDVAVVGALMASGLNGTVWA